MKWLIQYFKSFGDNFGKVDDNLYRGAKLDKNDYKKLQKLGIKTIVNLIDSAQVEAGKLASDNGFNFIHIPMSDSRTPIKLDIISFLSIARNADSTPVFVGCAGGRHRTGLLVAIYRVVVSGWTKGQAWDEAEKFGYYNFGGHQPLEDYFWYKFDKKDFE